MMVGCKSTKSQSYLGGIKNSGCLCGVRGSGPIWVRGGMCGGHGSKTSTEKPGGFREQYMWSD